MPDGWYSKEANKIIVHNYKEMAKGLYDPYFQGIVPKIYPGMLTACRISGFTVIENQPEFFKYKGGKVSKEYLDGSFDFIPDDNTIPMFRACLDDLLFLHVPYLKYCGTSLKEVRNENLNYCRDLFLC